MSKFKVGDIIEYEIAANPIHGIDLIGYEPRLEIFIDRGASGKFVKTEIKKLFVHGFIIEICGFECEFWTKYSHLPGFPRVVSTKEISTKNWIWT